MCGIAGFFSKKEEDEKYISGMVERIIHRGPDHQGVKGLLNDRIWLGHARLSIIDLSEQGFQPMNYRNDRYWLTYNGEIYNYIELKVELLKTGYEFCTDTDTEVILAAYAYWGYDCVNHFNGMFSFVILDLQKKEFFAARDRFGVKPFYYWIPESKNFLAIASEIKAFVDLPEWKPAVNGQRAYDYLKYGLTDHTNETMFSGVYQLFGGECMRGSLENPTNIKVKRWYDRHSETVKVTLADAAVEFKKLFFKSVELRLRSDVTVGSCLSGGLDSSSIVCAMNDILSSRGETGIQRVVSAKAGGTKHDETEFIEEVKRNRNIDGYFVEPTAEYLFEMMRKLVWYQDEPFGSTSIFAQWCVFEEARKQDLTVMLDGQAADELLAGYHRFFIPMFGQLFSHFHWGRFIHEMRRCHELHNYPYSFAVRGVMTTYLPEKMLNRLQNLYRQVEEIEWFSSERILAKEEPPRFMGSDRPKTVRNLSQKLFFYNNMPMLLRYEDRNSMAHSVESRLPFLDYRLVEFARSLPDDCKISDGTTKRVLREAMRGVLPDKITNRMDKIGFETQEEVWERKYADRFRGLIKDSVEMTNGIITDKAIDYFDGAVIRNGQDFVIWRIINFGIWYDMYIKGNYKELKRVICHL